MRECRWSCRLKRWPRSNRRAKHAQEYIGPLVAPAPTQLPRRHYFVVSKSPRGRESLPSSVASVPLEAGSSAPGKPVVTHTASDMTITGHPRPTRAPRRSCCRQPSSRSQAPTPRPGTSRPNSRCRSRRWSVKSLGFNTEATTYHVYDVTPVTTEPDPYAIALPKPITPAPLVEPEYVIKGVAFNAERCFEVRPIDTVFGSVAIGPPSPRTCVTPLDTFPPVAPKNLAAIAGSGVINLIWDANAESDLAGYIVLRGEAPGDTLQAVTQEPVTVTSYRDESVRAGTRYVYVVVAVDRAVPQNVSPQSNCAE